MKAPTTTLDIATAIKSLGPSTLDELAGHVGASYETVRTHVAAMADDHLVAATTDRSTRHGRPPSRWRLTREGEHLFPKAYSDLAVDLLDLLSAQVGPEHVTEVLAGVVDTKVRAWDEMLRPDIDLEGRLDALRSIYEPDDAYATVERGDDGCLRLVERNCPYLDVASAHPELCALTINTLARVLGRTVVREERFQDGDGRCVFRVTDEPHDSRVFITEREADHSLS